MNIEINRSEAQELLDRLAVPPESAVALKLYDEINLALECEMPEATYPPMSVEEIPMQGRTYADVFYRTDLPPVNVPKDLIRPTLGVAQNIVKRVAGQIASNTIDRNEAYLDLERVVGMLAQVLDASESLRKLEGCPSEAPEGSIQRNEATRDQEELQ